MYRIWNIPFFERKILQLTLAPLGLKLTIT